MASRPRLGFLGLLVVVIVALIAGGVGGAAAAMAVGKSGTSAPAASQSAQPASVTSLGQLSGKPMSWVQVAQRDGPAVVTIINQQKPQQDIFGNLVPGSKDEGSGFAIDTKGDIVTNNHVVENEQSLTVVFADGHKTPATLVRADPLSDLAVVRVHTAVPAIVHFGNSNQLLPGEPVMAIGSALGQFRNSVTTGVVSALGRTINEPNGVTLQNMLQTDAPINQGNSGGPLLDDRGEVIGVNTAITRGTSQTDPFGLGGSQSVVAEGLGFAIPSSTVKSVAARLVQNKPPAFLGVSYHQITQQDSTFYNLPIGAYVNAIRPGSPASNSGLKARDIITSISGQPINDTYSLEQIIAERSPGDTVKLTVWRGGKTLTISVKLGAKPKTLS
jgi:2-alkenal reductase